MIHQMTSFLEMQQHLGHGILRELRIRERAMTHVCREIQKESQSMLGYYQDGFGPFETWQPLAEATQADRSAMGFPVDEPLLRNERLRNAIEISIGPLRHGDYEGAVGVASAMVGSGSHADPVRDIGVVAEAMELGTRRVPPRSFLGLAAARLANRVAEYLGKETFFALVGDQGATPYVHF
jgi:hypothetical protein